MFVPFKAFLVWLTCTFEVFPPLIFMALSPYFVSDQCENSNYYYCITITFAFIILSTFLGFIYACIPLTSMADFGCTVVGVANGCIVITGAHQCTSHMCK